MIKPIYPVCNIKDKAKRSNQEYAKDKNNKKSNLDEYLSEELKKLQHKE